VSELGPLAEGANINGDMTTVTYVEEKGEVEEEKKDLVKAEAEEKEKVVEEDKKDEEEKKDGEKSVEDEEAKEDTPLQ